jgi:hypothetical protein
MACAAPRPQPASEPASEINVMPTPSDGGRRTDPPPREPEIVAPLPPPPPPNCRRDSDCVISVLAACCSLTEPYGVPRAEAREKERECKLWGQCIDYEGIELADDAKSYVAKCQAHRCVAVHR